MSSVIHPVGPQPPGVYWVRRVLALLVLVAVVAGIWWLVAGRGGDAPPPSAAPGPTDSASAGPSTTTTPSGSPSPTKTRSPSATRSTTPATTPAVTPSKATSRVPACKDGDIKVTATTDAASYTVGETPRLRMRITSTAEASCRRDVGSEPNELIVNKDGERFWSSDDCNPAGSSDVVVLQPGESYSVTLSWLGHGSSAGCPSNPPTATAGSYSLVGRNGEVMSSPRAFSLT